MTRLILPSAPGAQKLADAVQQYLRWMKQSSYSASTIGHYERLLKHFQSFIHRKKVPIDDVFTYKTLQEFTTECRLHLAQSAVQGLGRYMSCPIEPPRRRLGEIYEDYLRFYHKDHPANRNCLSRITLLLSQFSDYLAKNSIAINRLRIEDVDRFIAKYNARYRYATRRNIRTYMRGFLKYLYYERGIIKRDLAALVVGAVEFARSKPPKFLKPEEIRRLFEHLKSTGNKDLRTAAMVHLGYLLGLRPKEIAAIRLDDIGFTKSRIRIADRKCANPLRLPLPEDTIKAIGAYVIAGRPKTDHRQLFINHRPPYRPVSAASVCHDITSVLKVVNPAATAYWLRHTYAQNMLESGASIFEIKEMMGHDSIQSTRRYLAIHTELMRKVLFDETL